MLPLPRRRFDPEDVRERLRALADGSRAPHGSAPTSIGDLLDAGEDPEPERVVLASTSVRPVVVAIGSTALAAWLVVRLTAGGPPSPVELVPGTPIPSGSASGSLVPGPAVAGAAAGAGASPVPPAALLVVQVIGEVRHPGLVRLEAGSRVADAIRSAGGLVAGGRSGGLNLARPVIDGEQIVVSRDALTSPGTGNGAAAGSGGAGSDVVVDLNTATASDLDTLPGVGPVMAGRILDWRTANGRFASIDQLREVSGIGARTFERLKPHVRV